MHNYIKREIGKMNLNHLQMKAGTSSQLLEVDWQLRKPLWSEQNRYLLENAVWTDCVFVVGSDPEHTKVRSKGFLAIKGA